MCVTEDIIDDIKTLYQIMAGCHPASESMFIGYKTLYGVPRRQRVINGICRFLPCVGFMRVVPNFRITKTNLLGPLWCKRPITPLKVGNWWVITYHTYWTCDYTSRWGLKIIHVSKRCPWNDSRLLVISRYFCLNSTELTWWHDLPGIFCISWAYLGRCNISLFYL